MVSEKRIAAEAGLNRTRTNLNYRIHLHRCRCGWRLLGSPAWCPNCEQHAIAAAIISCKAGKLFINGISVEDWR